METRIPRSHIIVCRLVRPRDQQPNPLRDLPFHRTWKVYCVALMHRCHKSSISKTLAQLNETQLFET